MNNLTVSKYKMFDIVVHEPTRFIFQFFQYEDENKCSVMDEDEGLYTFPVDSIRKGTKKDMEEFKKSTSKKFQYLRNYL